MKPSDTVRIQRRSTNRVLDTQRSDRREYPNPLKQLNICQDSDGPLGTKTAHLTFASVGRELVEAHAFTFEFMRQRALTRLTSIELLDAAGDSKNATLWLDALRADLASDVEFGNCRRRVTP